MKLVVILPALNEEENIVDVLNRIPKKMDNVDVIEKIVIDDGSTDRTKELSEKAGAIVVSHPQNMGLGVAFKTALREVLERKADIMVQIDADGQFKPEDIPKIIEPVLTGEAHMVSASRFADPNLIPEDIPPVKKWGNFQVSRLVSFLAGQKFMDVSCGFRAYGREALLKLNPIADFTYTQEVFLELVYKGLIIKEVPVEVKGKREIGESRVARSIPKYAYQISRIMMTTFRDYKPFAFFGILSLILFSLGIVLDIIPLVHKLNVGRFYPYRIFGLAGLSLNFIGILVFFMAFLADINNRQRMLIEETLYFEKKRQYYND